MHRRDWFLLGRGSRRIHDQLSGHVHPSGGGPSLTAQRRGPRYSGIQCDALQFGVRNLITISGVVTQAGQPVPNVNVNRSNSTGTVGTVSTTTGSDGSYVLNAYLRYLWEELLFRSRPPRAGRSSCFSEDGRRPTLGDDNITPYPVGSQDIVQNFDFPATAPVTLTAVDATSDPLAGVGIGSNGGQLATTLPDGTPEGTKWSGPEDASPTADWFLLGRGSRRIHDQLLGTYTPSGRWTNSLTTAYSDGDLVYSGIQCGDTPIWVPT